MKERPILFSAPMVRALLAGTKTQTRRVIPTMTTLGRTEYPGPRDNKGYSQVNWLDTPEGVAAAVRECKYGQPGDRLWVRESLDYCSEYGHYYAATGPSSLGNPSGRIYVDYDAETPANGLPARHIPSIHMPRWASRITLEVTGVRVERLQDISEADAQAEGADSHIWDGIEDDLGDLIDWPLKEAGNPYRNGYALLWDEINGAGSWAANPWVWAVSFKVLKGGGL